MRRSNWMIFRGALHVAVLVALSVPMKPLLADTILNSGTTTVSTGTNFGGNLYVATTGAATLKVIAGGYATNFAGWLGDGAGSNGTVNVLSGGTWANSNALFVGFSGTGTLTVNGGSVTNSTGMLGYDPGSVGKATVSRGTWANSGDLAVGIDGTGTLNVTGGYVSNNNGILGEFASGVGTATVSSGTWASSSTLTVGYSGTGTLIITSREDPFFLPDVTGGSVTSSSSLLGYQAGSVGTATVSSGTWANSGDLAVGRDGTGTLNVTGGYVSNNNGILGDFDSGVGTATVSSGTWASSSTLTVGYFGTGTLNVTGGYVSNANGVIGDSFFGLNGLGTANVSRGTWANSGNLRVGLSSGTGTLTMSGGLVTVGGTLSQGTFGTINLNSGGTLQIGVGGTTGVLGVSTLTNNGTLVFNRSDASTYSGVISGTGSVTKQGAGTLTLSGNNSYSGDTTISGGVLQVGAGGTTGSIAGNVVNNATLAFNRSDASTYSGVISGTGSVTKQGGGTLTLSGNNSYSGDTTISGGVLQVGAGGTTGSIAGNVVNNGTLVFNRSNASTHSNFISGTGTIQNAGAGTTTLTGQTSFTNGLGATAGRLIVGSASSVNGFSTTGNLTVASGATLELKSRGLAYVNGLSTLAGGTIRAANGISLGAGANVVGTGVISGFVSASYGSRVEADGGKLTVGDASSYVGFASAGLLYTNANEVELLDRNLAVLGSLTQLGDGSSGGTLRAANGMLLEQGKNLVGRGTVYGNFVNQGDVYGDGSTTGQEIVFAAGSTVSGNGSFTNALFRGTYSPGNSPAITSLQDGGFAQSSTLLIEVGGTQAGSQYDQVQDASTLSLGGGSLNVVLTNSFVPAPGNSFQILRYGQLSGDFGAVNLPAFDNGLGWQRLTTGTSMTLVAAPSAVSINVAAGSKTLAAAGYSSLVYATSLNKSGAGALVLNSPNALTGPTTIQQGTVQLADASALATSTISPLAGGVLSLTPGLQATIGGLNANAGGLVDVGTGMVTVANGLSTKALVTALQTGRSGGSWTGSSGIASSAAASSNGTRTVGWLDNGNGSVTFAYAASGDTNLDWSVDILDAGNFLTGGKFDTGLPATWSEGDFNYDATVDILDAADFFSTSLYDAGSYNPPAGTIAAVPEPSVLGMFGVGAGVVGLMAHRRKRVG